MKIIIAPSLSQSDITPSELGFVLTRDKSRYKILVDQDKISEIEDKLKNLGLRPKKGDTEYLQVYKISLAYKLIHDLRSNLTKPSGLESMWVEERK